MLLSTRSGRLTWNLTRRVEPQVEFRRKGAGGAPSMKTRCPAPSDISATYRGPMAAYRDHISDPYLPIISAICYNALFAVTAQCASIWVAARSVDPATARNRGIQSKIEHPRRRCSGSAQCRFAGPYPALLSGRLAGQRPFICAQRTREVFESNYPAHLP